MAKLNDNIEINNLLNKYIEESLEEHKFKFLLMFNGEYNSLKLDDMKVSKMEFDGIIDTHYELIYNFILSFKGQGSKEDSEIKSIVCRYISFYKNGEKSIRELSYDNSFLGIKNYEIIIDAVPENTDPIEEKVMNILKEINFMDFIRETNIDKDLCSTLR